MKIICGDSLEVLKTMEDNSVDSICSDPPYGLKFMGKKWDYDVPSVEVWKECLRVLKPGGHALVACGTRTQHRMAVNLEDAGFEIRDLIFWHFGSGFPKSHNIEKSLKKMGEVSKAEEYKGFGTALKPSTEIWTLCRKPLEEKTIAANVLKYGTGGINIDECRVEYQGKDDWDNTFRPSSNVDRNCWLKEGNSMPRKDVIKQSGRFPANLIHSGEDEVVEGFPDTKSTPHSHNHKKDTAIYGNGKGLGIREGGSLFNDSGSASRFFYCAKASKSERNQGLEEFEEKQTVGGGGGIGDYKDDVNSMSGKYGSEKAPSKNNHPTVKPIKLMQYLVRLITPKGGTVLDPYIGSGSTGIGAKLEGFDFIGIEREQEYCDIAEARLKSYPKKDLTS